MSSDKHKWQSQFEMSYEQEYLWKYTEWVYLIREMEKELGKDQAHKIVRKARQICQTIFKQNHNRIVPRLSQI